ncbi:uncharacterized protein B4U79_11465, partial [Dinothrombium tinctorium]
MNMDQVGFQYEFVSKRTLEKSGTKQVITNVQSKNKTKHSYTVLPLITKDGELLSPLYICLMKTGGKFGKNVQNSLPNYTNVFIDCSSSGKMTILNVENWIKSILKPNISEKCLLHLDSFTSH